MRISKTLSLGVGTMVAIAASVVTVSPSEAKITNPSKFRKISANGIGNCIFSPEMLPYRNEGAPGYRMVKSTFSSGANIHVRCYWPKTGSEYRSVGKIWNSIRNANRHRTSLVWERPREVGGASPDFYVVSVKTTHEAKWANADQQRFDIYQQADCDFKLLSANKRREFGVTSPHHCVDLDAFAAVAPGRERMNDPSVMRFCVKQYVEAADEMYEHRYWDNALKKYRTDRQRVEYDHMIARGCFDYKTDAPVGGN